MAYNLYNSQSKWSSYENRYWTAAITVKEGRRPCQEAAINIISSVSENNEVI